MDAPQTSSQVNSLKKRAPTSYALFVREHWKQRDRLDMPFVDFNQNLAQRWRSMGDEEKGAWKILAQQEEDRIAKARAKNSHQIFNTSIPRKTKRPLSSYMHFVKEKRAQVIQDNPGLKLTDVTRILGTMWSALSDSEKAKYAEMAENDRTRYTAAKNARQDGTSSTSQRTKRPVSSFMYFAKEKRAQVTQENPGLKVTDITRILGTMWSALSDSEKARYAVMAENDRTRYYAATGKRRNRTRSRSRRRR